MISARDDEMADDNQLAKDNKRIGEYQLAEDNKLAEVEVGVGSMDIVEDVEMKGNASKQNKDSAEKTLRWVLTPFFR